MHIPTYYVAYYSISGDVEPTILRSPLSEEGGKKLIEALKEAEKTPMIYTLIPTHSLKVCNMALAHTLLDFAIRTKNDEPYFSYAEEMK